MKLGRLVEHDPRSRLYQAPQATTPRSVLWGHHAPVLDQGQIGSCTGNATAQLINTDAFAHCRSHYLTEADAVKIYSLATHVDGLPGTYPPDDSGSSGLGAAKAGVKLGYFTGYKHTFSFDAFCGALQIQPLIVGTNWYDAMFKPDKKGYVHPTGSVAGGHEYLALGIQYETKTITFLNSWSASWGQNGRFYMTFTDFAALLADQGDATAPIPKVIA